MTLEKVDKSIQNTRIVRRTLLIGLNATEDSGFIELPATFVLQEEGVNAVLLPQLITGNSVWVELRKATVTLELYVTSDKEANLISGTSGLLLGSAHTVYTGASTFSITFDMSDTY